jgi:hypothetical protein
MMTMKMKISRPILALLIFALAGCHSTREIAGNYVYKTECMGSELDGSVTVKAWGNGSNRADAIEQAKKNAVNDVLFRGITEGKNGCFPRPLVTEVNARTRYETYFNRFFKDGGEYKKYISMKDERIGNQWNSDKKGARQSVTYGIVVRVLRADLKTKLTKDGILKQ